MEDRRRNFEPIKINVLGAETGESRFYRDGLVDAPAVADWRVNLTALSQRYNLFFIATCHRIQVYRPDFPYQRLGAKPALTIVPQLDNADAHGFIDSLNPHNLNHLIIGELGNQEILLLSTDSGNVVAYYTSAIKAAIGKDPYRFSADALADFVGLRPFFSQWVHESAWGLAIHSAGRMIAVSANHTHNVLDSDPGAKITVFAFALTTPNSDDQYDEVKQDGHDVVADHGEWRKWDPLQHSASLDVPPRDCNYKIVLTGREGHKHNIPSVAFINNSGDVNDNSGDVNGSWLLSTDIAGRMKMWQIWKGRCYKTWDFADVNSAWMRNDEAGWLVAALDIKAFRPARSMENFIGYHHARQHYGHQHPGDSYDITNVVQRHTPQSSRYYPSAQMDEGENSEAEEEEEDERDTLFQAMADPDDMALEEQPQSTEPATEFHRSISPVDTSQPGRTTVQLESQDGESSSERSDDESSGSIEIIGDFSDEDEEHDSENADNDDTSPNSDRSATTMSSFEHEHVDQADTSQLETPTNETVNITSMSFMARGTKSRNKNWPSSSRLKAGARVVAPSIPIIQCSTSHVRLFGHPNANSPHLFCARMLKQILPLDLERRRFFLLDRLNMFHQIPELGIVLIASQLGRCAVCSLTKRENDGLLGLRVDWILPTKKQEKANVRPYANALLGIAAGPIQGQAPHESAPMSEYDNDDTWARDRVIGGIPTTFDPYVVKLRPNSHLSNENPSDDDRASQIHLKHSDDTNRRPESPAIVLEQRKWKRTDANESWRASESSRTYRLMLTYTDLTVLTYEISRAVEREDIRAA